MSTEVGVAHVSIIAKTSGLGKELVKQLQGADSEAAKTGQKMGKSLSGGFKGVMKTAAIGAAAAAAVGVGLGKVAYDIGKTFDTMSDTIRVGTGATGKALDDLNASAKNVGKNVPATFEDTGTVVADLNTLLGLTGKPLENMSTQFLNLSRITGTDVQTNIASVTRAFGDWGVEAEKQPEFLDKLFRASQATGVGVDALAAGMVQFGAPMRGMGFEVEETAALLGQFEKTGVNTELVMGSMRIALGKFAKEGKDAPAALSELMEQIKNAPSDSEAASMAMEIFGQRAGADMADSIRGGKFEIEELMGSVAGSSDTINKAAEDTMDFSEKWQVFKNRALLAVEPVTSAVFNFAGTLMDKALPVIEEITGGITAFGEAWKANDGDITSSGFPGFMERLAYQARQAFDYIVNTAIPALKDFGGFLRDNKDTLLVIAGGLVAYKAATLGVAAAQKIMTTWTTLQTIAQKGLNGAMKANPIGAVITALTLLIAGVVYAYNNIGWFKDGVDAAWVWIKKAFSGTISWITDTAFPALMNALQWVGDKFVWLNDSVIQPVWSWIKGAIESVVGWFTGTVVPAFKEAVNRVGGFFDFLYRNFIAPFVYIFKLGIETIVDWFKNTVVPMLKTALDALGRAFRWLYDNFINPVWTWIRDKIAAFWDWYVNVFGVAIRRAIQKVGEFFVGLYNTYVKPVFDWIKAKIDAVVKWFQDVLVPMFRRGIERVMSKFTDFKNRVSSVWEGAKTLLRDGWNWIADKVFDPFKRGLDKLKDGFVKTKDGIKDAWEKLREAVRKPIDAVVTKVVNPFLVGYNKINDAWSGDNVGPLKGWSDGYRKGGYTGAGNPGAAAGIVHKDEHVIRSESRRDIEKRAPGLLDRLNSGGASALPSFGHEGHAAHGGMAAGGPGGPGTYLWGALQNAIYASGVAHVRGSAPGYNIPAAARAWNNMSNLRVKYGTGQNQINVGGGAPGGTWGYAWTNGQIALNPGIPGNMKTGVAAHEIGHVLGLDHAGTNSIMHPMMRGPLWPSGFDRASIQRIYGGSGKGNPPEGGGGGFSILGAIKGILSKPLNALKSLLDGGNAFSKMAGGLAKNVVNGIMEKASGGRIDDIWDAPVGTTHALRPGVSSIYNGTGGVEHFKRVDPSDAGNGLHIHGDVYTVDEAEFANKVFRKIDQRRSLAYAA